MANTNKITNVIVSQKEAFVYFSIASDGTQETNLPIFDSSVVAAAFGDTDPLLSAIIEASVQVAAASTARVVLRYDASTPLLALSIPSANGSLDFCAGDLMCLPNLTTTGRTGDVTITTTGLASGDSITGVLRIKRQ